MAGRNPARFALLAAALLAAGAVRAAESPTIRQTVTLAELFAPDEAAALARTLRADRKLNFRVRVPPGDGPHGVLVFVHPGNSAEPMEGWAEVLDRRDLVYIAAENFGNDKPGTQRALVALLALKHLSRTLRLDAGRRYVGGMSGGGKMASQVLSRFPDFFDGALCIVGADPIAPAARLADKRVVFITGNKDFNHYDVLAVHKRLLESGLAHPHLMDLDGFGHQYPDARQFDAALALLDPR
jgi:poly(3-hydroxybutyrate) depolymerase